MATPTIDPLDHSGMVWRAALRYSHTPIPLEDLAQAGWHGLLLAIQRFDPERGFGFSAFARPYVHGYVLNLLRDWQRQVPRSSLETLVTGADGVVDSRRREPAEDWPSLLRGLTPLERQVIERKYRLGETSGETAEALGISGHWVRQCELRSDEAPQTACENSAAGDDLKDTGTRRRASDRGHQLRMRLKLGSFAA